jgi:hypothetical protein
VPEDVLAKILSFLDPTSQAQVSVVDKNFTHAQIIAHQELATRLEIPLALLSDPDKTSWAPALIKYLQGYIKEEKQAQGNEVNLYLTQLLIYLK